MASKSKTKQASALKLEIVYRNPDDLIPSARNSRGHDVTQVSSIAASIKTFGFNNPILIDETSEIIAGEGRWHAARKLAMKEVPCIVLAHLSDIERRAYLIADNKLYESGGSWLEEKLNLELADLKLADIDLPTLGFEFPELEQRLGAVQMLPAADLTPIDPDAIPEAPTDPVTKRGDVWLLGPHRLMCGDSTSIDDLDKLMREKELVTVIFTDPPYGVKFEQGKYCPTAGKKFRGTQIINDSLQGDDLTEFIAAAFSAAATRCVATAAYTWSPPLLEGFAIARGLQSAGLHIQSQIVWAKNTFVLGRCDYHWQHEICWYGYFGKNHPWYGERDKGSVWNVNKMQAMELHPTQKPVELAEIGLTNSSKEGDIVLDIFGGSGMTLIAAEKLKRVSRIMELEPKFVDVMIKRWEAFTSDHAVLESTGESYGALVAAAAGKSK